MYGQQPTTQKEMERKYYHTRLQFLDIRMQMIQEESELLQNQKEQIEKSQKSFHTMDIHEMDDVIFEMSKEKQKMETQEEQYQQLLSETADIEENKDKRNRIIYSHRLLQIRLKKMIDQIEDAQRTRHLRRMEKEQHPNANPATSQKDLSVRPKDNINYPDSTFYKNLYKNKKRDSYSGLFDIPKYSTVPIKPVEEKKKITPSLPTFGYVAKQGEKFGKIPQAPIKKMIRTYQAETIKSKPIPESEYIAPEWTNLKLSATEYVQAKYPMVESDDPTITHHPIYRKFNADGLNDYCQISIEIDFDKNQEVIIIKEMIGHITGWEQTITPLCVPINLAHEYIGRLKRASETRLDSFVSDLKFNKCLLYHNQLERHQIRFEFTIKSEVGPQGRERLITLQRDHKDPRRAQSIKIPWIQLPRFIYQLQLFMEEYEFTPVDLKNS